jgi:hypothetical protein
MFILWCSIRNSKTETFLRRRKPAKWHGSRRGLWCIFHCDICLTFWLVLFLEASGNQTKTSGTMRVAWAEMILSVSSGRKATGAISNEGLCFPTWLKTRNPSVTGRPKYKRWKLINSDYLQSMTGLVAALTEILRGIRCAIGWSKKWKKHKACAQKEKPSSPRL